MVGYGSSSVAQAGRGNKPPYWGYYGSVAANTIKPNRLLSPLQHKKIHILRSVPLSSVFEKQQYTKCEMCLFGHDCNSDFKRLLYLPWLGER